MNGIKKVNECDEEVNECDQKVNKCGKIKVNEHDEKSY
jgi:hypothetical protein